MKRLGERVSRLKRHFENSEPQNLLDRKFNDVMKIIENNKKLERSNQKLRESNEDLSRKLNDEFNSVNFLNGQVNVSADLAERHSESNKTEARRTCKKENVSMTKNKITQTYASAKFYYGLIFPEKRESIESVNNGTSDDDNLSTGDLNKTFANIFWATLS